MYGYKISKENKEHIFQKLLNSYLLCIRKFIKGLRLGSSEMSILAINKVRQKHSFTSEIDVKKEINDFSGHFTRYDLELRELETQAREFQKLAARLFSEGHPSISNDILHRREQILARQDEVRHILSISV